MYDTPPDSFVLGSFTEGGFKLIDCFSSWLSVFEVGTKFALSLYFSVLPSIVLCSFLENCSCLEYVCHTKTVNFCPASFTLIRVGVAFQVPLVLDIRPGFHCSYSPNVNLPLLNVGAVIFSCCWYKWVML